MMYTIAASMGLIHRTSRRHHPQSHRAKDSPRGRRMGGFGAPTGVETLLARHEGTPCHGGHRTPSNESVAPQCVGARSVGICRTTIGCRLRGTAATHQDRNNHQES